MIRRRVVRVTSGHASANDPTIPSAATRSALRSPDRSAGRNASAEGDEHRPLEHERRVGAPGHRPPQPP